jgi:hypothetical protein
MRIALPRQEWSRERASVLTNVYCLSYYILYVTQFIALELACNGQLVFLQLSALVSYWKFVNKFAGEN